MAEREERSKLGLSKFAAEAAEETAQHRDKLGIAGSVKDVASVHKTVWPDEMGNKPLLNIGILTGEIPVYDAPTGEADNNGPDGIREELFLSLAVSILFLLLQTVACYPTVGSLLTMSDMQGGRANALSECKHRSKLGLSLYTATAAERAAESGGDLRLSRNVRDVAAVLLCIGILTGEIPVPDAPTSTEDNNG
jgi:hypothetical protein